jgi:hypothetical protein
VSFVGVVDVVDCDAVGDSNHKVALLSKGSELFCLEAGSFSCVCGCPWPVVRVPRVEGNMGVVSRVGAGEFPVVFAAYPWLLDTDKVKVVLKGELECYQMGSALVCHIRLENGDRLAPHSCCCVEVAPGQLASAF